MNASMNASTHSSAIRRRIHRRYDDVDDVRRRGVRKATHRDASTTRTNADDARADQGAGTGTAAPLDVDELGRASWALMHTIAAYYPQKPTHAQRVQARRFFDALGDLYPCATCRADLRADVDAHPPRCESREALAKWVCERHNVVNEKLGKAKMSCAIDALDARWRRAKTTEGREETEAL